MKKKFTLIKWFFILALIISSNAAYSSEADILREIKSLREDTARKIKNLCEDMNMRFEQVDKRFEAVDKRFDQLMWFIGLWIPLSMAIVGYILQRLNKHDDRFYDLSHKDLNAEEIITAIRKARPETLKRLKEALKD